MKKKHRILTLITALTLIFTLFVNAAEVAVPPEDISAVDPAENAQAGINYEADVIVTGKINGEYDGRYYINLTKETLTVPEEYKIAAYSVDGGVRWTVSNQFDNASLAELLNRDFTLAFTNNYDRNKRPTADATVVKFAKIKRRPTFTNTYVVNYSIGADVSGLTSGTWVLTAPKGTESLKEGIEIAAANSAGNAPDSRGYGRFYGENGSSNGIEIAELPANGKAVKTSYFVRKGAYANADGTYTAASTSSKITVKGQPQHSAYTVDKTKKIINYPANTYVYRDDYSTPELKKTKGTLDISNYNGDVYLWSASNETDPASSMQKMTVTSAGNAISTLSETVATLSESSESETTEGIAPPVGVEPRSYNVIRAASNTSLSPMTLPVGATRTITIGSLADGETISNWGSSNSTFATVDSTGNVKALALGTTIITAMTDQSNSYTCSVTVVEKFAITSTTPSSALAVNEEYSYRLTTTEYTPMPSVTWQTSGTLPNGLKVEKLSDNNYYLTGTPTNLGSYSFDITATINIDGVNYSDTKRFNINITNASAPPVIWNDSTAQINCLVGKEYTLTSPLYTFTALDGYPLPVIWAAGGLPNGLSIDPSSGKIIGTAKEPDVVSDDKTTIDYPFTVFAYNNDRTKSASKNFNLTLVRTYAVKYSVRAGAGTGTLRVTGGDSTTNAIKKTVFVRMDDTSGITFTADADSNYRVKQWLVNGVPIDSLPTKPAAIPSLKVKQSIFTLTLTDLKKYRNLTLDGSPPYIEIEVEFEPVPQYTIYFNVTDGDAKGTITAMKNSNVQITTSPATVYEDDNVVFTANPKDPANWVIEKWTVNNDTLVGKDGSLSTTGTGAAFTGNTFRLNEILSEEDYTSGKQLQIWVTVTFKEIDKYAVMFSADSGIKEITAKVGSSAIKSGDLVLQHKDVVFTVVPNDGYRVASWKLDSVPSGTPTSAGTPPDPNNKTNEYTLVNLIGPATVTVKSELIPSYSVTFEATATSINGSYVTAREIGGTVDLANGAYVGEGKSVEFTAYPADGYRIKSWTVYDKDGALVKEILTNVAAHRESNLSSSIRVVVTFEKIPTIDVTNVTLNKSAAGIGIKGSETLTATVLPANVADKRVTWTIIPNADTVVRAVESRMVLSVATSSSLTGFIDYAAVDDSGKITVYEDAFEGMTFDVIATSMANTAISSAPCTVTVTKYEPVTFIKLNQEPFNLTVGETKELKASVSISPVNASNKDLIWSSSNPAFATVDANGKVTAKAQGVTTITVKSADTATAQAAVVVTVTAASISLNPTDKDFGTQAEGYTAQTAQSIKINNAGNGGTGLVTITLEGSDAANFELNVNSISNIPAGGSDSFTVKPKTGLPQREYTASVIVSCVYGGTKSLNVTFEVTEPIKPTAPTITTDSLPDGSVGEPYAQTIARAGTTPITLKITSGESSLKSYGLEFNNGTISGTPTKAGTISFNVEASNVVTPPNAVKTFSITIAGVVTAVTLNPSTVTIEAGESLTPTPMFTPSNAANKNLTWSSDNTTIATVDSTGKITAKAAGKANITATTDNGKSAKCAVTVVITGGVTGVTLNTSATTIAVGNSTTLTATVSPSNAKDKNVSWSSSDSSVAGVDSNGKVTGVKAGTATITVTTANGGKTAKCTVTVTTAAIASGASAVTGLTLNKTALTLAIGGSGVLTPIITPSNSTNKSVTWESTNSNVATVDQSGKVYGLSEGTALITATTKDGNKAATCMVTVTEFPVTGVTLNKTASTMAVGDTDTLTANVAPSNAGNKAVVWGSNNITVATVDQNGKITAKATGTASITVTTTDGNKTAACTVTVTGIAATGITMKSSTTIAVGSSETLIVTFTPTNVTNQTLTWTSDNVNVAAVDSSGKITAKAQGTAAVTAKTADGKTAICSVTVSNISVTGITMKSSTTIAVGSSETLAAAIAPSNATNKTIMWSSSDTSVATVDNTGKVTGAAVGVATVSASTADGNKTAVCKVVVEIGYAVTLGQSTGGAATSSHAKATSGTRVTLTETPNNGYYIVGWQTSPADLSISGNSFTMPDANVTVTPVFKQILTLGSYITPANIDTRNPSYTIAFTGTQLQNGSAGVCLPGSDLANITSKNSEFIIEITTPFGAYQVPAKLASLIPDLNDILAKNNLKISDIGFNVTMTDKSGDKAIVNALANSMPKAKIIGSPVDFTIEIVRMINGNPGAVIGTIGDNLTERITRLIPLPQSVTTLPEYWGAFRYNETADRFEFVPHTTRIINGVLYVIVNSASNSVYVVAENPVSFTDVKPEAWYTGYVYKSASKRLVQGVGNGLYQPERNVTRAEFVQMMVTALQLPKAKSGTTAYGDIAGEWYYDSIMRAKSAGILDKFKGDKFNPNQAITREEMAVILAAVLRYEKFSTSGSTVNLAGSFVDYANFNKEYASDVEIVYRLKIMQGMGDGKFAPKGTTTRAQAATVQIRLLEMLKLIA